MIVSINQPRYLPWLGYFHRIALSDVFICLDIVKYTEREWENRNKVKTAQGWTWLSVPVKAPYPTMIPEVSLWHDQPWQARHWKSIKSCYGKSPFFSDYSESLRETYEGKTWRKLIDLNMYLTNLICRWLGLNSTKFVMASELNVDGKGSELILNLCRAVGATLYFSGSEGRNYLDEAAFAEAGIQVAYQQYKHPVYPQKYGDFQPYMSVIDLLCNCGPESLEILMENQDGIEECLSTRSNPCV